MINNKNNVTKRICEKVDTSYGETCFMEDNQNYTTKSKF